MKIATVVPSTEFGVGSQELNLKKFENYLSSAKSMGADLVVFPESYPDNWQPPEINNLEILLSELAKKYEIHFVAGILEPSKEGSFTFYNTSVIFDDLGNEIGRYRRTTPNLDPWLYMGGGKWEYSWVRGNELPVFETRFGKIGLLICSEVYVPELARQMAKNGAEIIVYPTGLTSSQSPLYETWQTLVWARAIENLVITIATSNSTGVGGLSMVCSPENVILNTLEEGVHLSEVDLERIQLLRSSHDGFIAQGPTVPFKTKPGIFLDWIRPDLKF
jgi:predicted amidohydrolase